MLIKKKLNDNNCKSSQRNDIFRYIYTTQPILKTRKGNQNIPIVFLKGYVRENCISKWFF